jgi:hypothetical protein
LAATEVAGTGAFGANPGNVTIIAAANVYGHYVLADGVGTIMAGQNIGAPAGSDSFALSLIAGSWNVSAPSGNIYLQEVRNPNGVFNNLKGLGAANLAGQHLFNYAADAAVNLDAGLGVYLTDVNLPRLADANVPVLYPPILDITAGAGGVTLQDNVTLFPSANQNLNITTTDGGSLVSAPNTPGTTPELLMSDSSQTRWVGSLSSFTDGDHSTTLPVQAADSSPVTLTIAGSMENLNLITSKASQITVAGDMINCGFSGQNLHAGETTSLTVAGQIYNRGSYDFINGITISSVPAADLLPGMSSAWDSIFTLAVDPAVLASLTVPADTTGYQLTKFLLESASVFQTQTLPDGLLQGNNPGFVYDAATGRLGFAGQMPQSAESALTQPLTVLHLVNGVPVLDATGHYQTDTVNWVAPAQIAALAQASVGAPSPIVGQLGYRLGGPGQFDITANSISLGNTYGIFSCGVQDVQGGFGRYANLASVTPEGATVNVTVAADQAGTVVLNDAAGTTIAPHASLDMLTSTIAAIGGGDVNVTSTGGSMNLGSQDLFNVLRQEGLGIFTSGRGNVNVTAFGDIDVNGSRIATFNGGDITVESLTGNVDAGSGGASFNGVGESYVDPTTQLPKLYTEEVYGSGILANTLVDSAAVPGSAKVPGNITIITPQGDIIANLGGILQEALNGNIAAGPTITLEAGTTGGHTGNIELGKSGVIGGTVNATANGNISGLIISRQNSDVHAVGSFTGTVLAGGSADVGAGGSVSGTIVGVGGASVSGGSISAQVLGQNVSVNGGAAVSTLGSSAGATSTSQAAAQQSSTDSKQELATTGNGDDDDKKKKKMSALLRRIKRVTVILPKI